MGLPTDPVTMTPQDIEELNRKLAILRHNVNNYLSLIIAAVEIIRRKPEMAVRMVETIAVQPQKIIDELKDFSQEFEKALQISKDSP